MGGAQKLSTSKLPARKWLPSHGQQPSSGQLYFRNLFLAYKYSYQVDGTWRLMELGNYLQLCY